jgi:UDP-2,3-diacylglucosamine hydrolase
MVDQQPIPRRLILIAGKGEYPKRLARSAKASGVEHLAAVAFRGETHPSLAAVADSIHWHRVGRLQDFLDDLGGLGIPDAVMAGQITPTLLFRLRPDRALMAIMKTIRERNAHSLFGTLADLLKEVGVTLRPAWMFMEDDIPGEGVLTRRAPDDREREDIALGFRVADATSGLDVGQTVVIREGTVLAVEAFEGTDRAIRRAGRLAGRTGLVVVKAAKRGHDMRFDIPVVGMKTIKTMRRAGAAALAVGAGETLLLDRERVVAEADRLGIAIRAVRWKEGEKGDVA